MATTRTTLVLRRDHFETATRSLPDDLHGGMLISVELAGICGTDVHILRDANPFPGESDPYPFPYGHEVVGRIERLPSGDPRDAQGKRLEVGDRVVSNPSSWSCGLCYACRMLLSPNICLHPEHVSPPNDLSAGFADHVVLPKGSISYRIPDELPTSIAVLIEPMAGASRAVHRAMRLGNPDRGEGFGPGLSAAIQGSGAIGALMTALLRYSGAAHVAVIGAPIGRLNLCHELGADRLLNLDSTTPEERLRAIQSDTAHNLGVDVVFEASGSPYALPEAINLVRIGGTIVEFGAYTSRGLASIDPALICRKDLSILGSHGYGPGQFGIALTLLQRLSRIVPIGDIVTHILPLTELGQGIDLVASGAAMKVAIQPNLSSEST
jgi:threonine dehydrogenase-like Zn-dependent dehydrogenase